MNKTSWIWLKKNLSLSHWVWFSKLREWFSNLTLVWFKISFTLCSSPFLKTSSSSLHFFNKNPATKHQFSSAQTPLKYLHTHLQLPFQHNPPFSALPLKPCLLIKLIFPPFKHQKSDQIHPLPSAQKHAPNSPKHPSIIFSLFITYLSSNLITILNWFNTKFSDQVPWINSFSPLPNKSRHPPPSYSIFSKFYSTRTNSKRSYNHPYV